MSARPGFPDIPGVELLEVIGRGGSGVVYRGHQPGFGRDVAVKVVTVRDASDDAVRRWEREIEAIGRLSNHPNIVPVFAAAITDDGFPYLVMPHVPGGTLDDRVRNTGPLAPEEAAQIGAKLAGTLATVHAAGVLHRDVKPDNVLWSPYGEPQLTDFGIARLRDRTTTLVGGLQATIAFAAPEVLSGQETTEASDVYGLGATLYACLTGSPPHPTPSGESVAALVARVVGESPPPLGSVGVPEPLASVVDRAMARDPGDRYVTARQFQRELDGAAAVLAGAEAASTGPTAAGWAGAGSTDAGPTDAGSTDAGSTDAASRTDLVPAVPVGEPVRDEVTQAASVWSAAPADGTEPVRAPVEPAAEPEPDPFHDVAHDDGGRRGLWVAVAIVLVVFVGLVALATRTTSPEGNATDTTDPPPAAADDADTTLDPSTSDPTTPDPTTTAEPVDAPTSSSPSDPTTSDPTTTAPADDDRQTSSDLNEAALGYIGALDRGDFDAAWSRTSPRFQASQDRGSWRGFWSSFDSIDVVGEPRADQDRAAVVVPLSFDGQREDYRLTFVAGDDGGWLVDGPLGN